MRIILKRLYFIFAKWQMRDSPSPLSPYKFNLQNLDNSKARILKMFIGHLCFYSLFSLCCCELPVHVSSNFSANNFLSIGLIFFNVKIQHTFRKWTATSILLSYKVELKRTVLSRLGLRKWYEVLRRTENTDWGGGAPGSLGSSLGVQISLPFSAYLFLAPPSPRGKPFKAEFFFPRQEQVIKYGTIFSPKPAIKSRIITLTFPCLPI